VGVKLEPNVKDGDGRIMKLNMAATEWIDKDKWAAIKLDAPKGMAIIGKSLYVADIDRVVEIDLKKTEQRYVYDFSRFNTVFLNDITVKNDSTLFVSATDLNCLFQINLKDQNYVKMKTNELHGPNGITYVSEGNKIYCVEYGEGEKVKGRVVTIDANTGAVRQVGKHKGGLDGVAFSADGSLLFSDWDKGHLQKMNIQTGAVTEVPSDSIKGPADFYYHIPTKQAFVPRMMENQVLILNVE
jgi:glucose/arabinose dehydrogenase